MSKSFIKVAIATFHHGFGQKDVCGVAVAPVYLKEQLREYFDVVDLITFNPIDSSLSPLAGEANYSSDANILSKYDFVIFTAPGVPYEKYNEKFPHKYNEYLEAAKNFTIMFHDENDRKLHPYINDFLNHPNLSFLTFNCPGMANSFQDYVSIVGDFDYLILSPKLPPLEEILSKAKTKSNKIMSTSRWTTFKRIYEYLSMAPEFNRYGIDVYAAGAHSSYWYDLKMSELPKDSYTDLGYYEPSQLPDILKDVKYHWNFGYHARSKGNMTQNPRIELATLEALSEGCLPIICKEFTPYWLGDYAGIRMSKDDYTKIPEVLSGLSDEERYQRITEFYVRFTLNTEKRISEYSKHIEEAVNAVPLQV